MSRGRIAFGVIAGFIGAVLALAPAAFADGHGGHGEGQTLRGTVTAFTLPAATSASTSSGNGSMTLTENNGSSVTLVLTPTTSIQMSASALAGLLAGGQSGTTVSVAVQGSSGTEVAVSIRGVAPQAGGEGEGHAASVSGSVYAVSSGSFTLQTEHGSSLTIDLSPSTVIKLGGQIGSPTDITVGARAEVAGSAGPTPGTFDATVVRLANEHSDQALTRLSGTVASAPTGSPPSFTMKTAGGSTVTVELTAATIIRAGDHLGTPQQLTQGAQVQLLGTANAGGFAAQFVNVSGGHSGNSDN